jgi:hypothetical protein
MFSWLGIAVRIARRWGGDVGTAWALFRSGKALRLATLMVEGVRRLCW